MKVSVIGTGRMGTGLVRNLHPVMSRLVWGSRNPAGAQQLIEKYGFKGVEAAEIQTALQADIIFHALWFRDLIPWAESCRELLKGKILVDLVNPFTEDFSDFTMDWGTSAAEELQHKLPETSVVGAFKNTFFQVLEKPVHQGTVSDVYVTSDDEKAKLAVIQLLQGIPFRIMDAGRLSNNRTIERMTLFERELAIRYGHYPYVSYRIFGQGDEQA
ncbi:NADPH-dependent F420 reductase [Paenibacillus rigui]|nr:NAD(P)-binding domain-containing protein [Paenibacillus rigui]